MPILAAMNKKHSPNGLIMLGFYAQQATKEEIIAFCKANKIDYSTYDNGDVEGVERGGIPLFVLFDAQGDMLYNGHSAAELIGKVDAAMKTAPDPLVGEGPYKKLAALVAKIKERKNLGQILATIKTKHLVSENEEEKAEAEKLAAKLTQYGNRLMQKADKKKDSEPMSAFNLYQQLAALYKGDEIGDNADKIVKDLKEDKTFQENMKADKELTDMMPEIEKLKSCGKDAAFNKDCANCKKKNGALDSLVTRGKSLIKKYPSSPAAEKIKSLLPLE